jgi:hypothetical protein
MEYYGVELFTEPPERKNKNVRCTVKNAFGIQCGAWLKYDSSAGNSNLITHLKVRTSRD